MHWLEERTLSERTRAGMERARERASSWAGPGAATRQDSGEWDGRPCPGPTGPFPSGATDATVAVVTVGMEVASGSEAMSVVAVPAKHDAAVGVRFAPLVVNGVLTVWDAELGRYVVHQATWDAEAARDVAESLAEHPNYVRVWTWSESEEP